MPRIFKSGPGIGFLDGRYVNVTGDTMTGGLIISAGGLTVDGVSNFNEAGADVDFRIETDTNSNAFVLDAGIFGGVGQLSIGQAPVASPQAFVIIDNPALTATANDNFVKLFIQNTNAVTIPAGTAPLVASLAIDEPNITATGTITTATTLYIQDAPTEGVSNYALWIDAGTTRFDEAVGIVSVPLANTLLAVGGAASFAGSGTLAVGISLDYIASSAVTVAAWGNLIKLRTAASSFTLANLIGIEIDTPILGSGSTVTTLIGLFIDNQNIGSTSSFGISITQPGIVNGIGATTNNTALVINTATVTMSNQTATTTNAFGISVGITTFTSTTNTRTITNASSIYVAGAPVASTNVAITNGPYSLWIDTGSSRFDGRLLKTQGADTASANDLTLGSDGNTFEITGTTQINAITTTGWQNGAMITLFFTSTPTVKHNTAGGANTAVLLLSGAVDFSATANDTLTLVLGEVGGTQAWREVARTVI